MSTFSGKIHLKKRIVQLATLGFVLSLLLTIFSAQLSTRTAHAAATAVSPSLPDQTRVGIHNAYNKATFPYLVNALNSGAGMVEIDVWQDFLFLGGYKVSHNPPGDDNNCESATQYSQLGSQSRDQDFAACLDDIRLWSEHFPDHAPLIIKLELKNGFNTLAGYGPAKFDALIAQHIGTNNLFTPADLLNNTYPDLDSAARANAWPTEAQLTGKIMIVIQAGTVELAVTSYTSDKEYIDYMIKLASNGQIRQSMVFPTDLGAAAYDPRSGARKPWYVVFGGDATSYSSLDTSGYYSNHYLVIMTDAQNVPPAISDTAPSSADEQARVKLLAAHAASIVSSDWTSSTLDSYTTTRS
jgi:hypothetical protein